MCDPNYELGIVLARLLQGNLFVGLNHENRKLLYGYVYMSKEPKEKGMRHKEKKRLSKKPCLSNCRAWHQVREISAVKREPARCFAVAGLILVIPHLLLPSAGSDRTARPWALNKHLAGLLYLFRATSFDKTIISAGLGRLVFLSILNMIPC